MSFIYAKVNSLDMSAWTPENIAIVDAIPGVIATTCEGENDCCISAQIERDLPAARNIVKSIAKAFPQHAVTWS